MSITEIREKIHQLVDTASDGYLAEVLDLLEQEHSSSSSYKYSKEDIERFNEISQDLKNNPTSGMSVEEAHQFVRNTYKNGL